MYMFWHGGFPLIVVGYALLKDRGHAPNQTRRRAGTAAVFSVAAVLVIVCALTMLATMGQQSLPEIMQGNRYTPAMIVIVSSVWALSVIALVCLWRRRPRTVLDLWLMVVMCAWFFDVALSAVLNAGRFDLGFYAGRIYGLLAASFVLIMLVLENSMLYGRLVESHGKHARRLEILHEIDRAVAAEETPDAIAGAAIQPLREVLQVSRAVVNIFDLAAGEVEVVGRGWPPPDPCRPGRALLDTADGRRRSAKKRRASGDRHPCIASRSRSGCVARLGSSLLHGDAHDRGRRAHRGGELRRRRRIVSR